MKKKKLLTSQMDLELRNRTLKATVWSVAETWTMTQKHRKILEGFAMWIWRKMLKISWLQKVTNQEILNMVHEERNMISSIHQHNHNWIGHVLRHDGLLNKIIEGRIEGKRERGRKRRGRKRQQMIDDIMDAEKYGNLKRTSEDRTRRIGKRIQQTDVTCLLLLSRLQEEEEDTTHALVESVDAGR